ncbi:MAG: hypothetical protein ACK5MD_02425 [Flavobacteriales bacterium]
MGRLQGQEDEPNRCGFGCRYNQSDYQQSLNQSFYFIRGNGVSVEGGPNNGGVQNLIHSVTDTGQFNYPGNFRFNVDTTQETGN